MRERHFPATSVSIRLDMEVGLGSTAMPAGAARKLAWRLLGDIIGDVQAEELVADGEAPVSPVAAPVDVSDWDKPRSLDMRIVKSAHRMVLEVSQRGQSGRSVLASELVGGIGLSAPTVGRLLKEGEAANDYLRQFISATPAGRTKALDLTPKGRLLASKIRAGTIPA
jgi:hypothetical protein